ncbi:MAG: type II toxin-antitoxin system HicA family toxin [Candidatus Methanoperedens sp.]|nr:type II toxin-antitoxin system HicA family toxin [Candidatus Methanoperedens sp.]
MTKLMPVSWKLLVKRLQDFGFEGPFSGGKHPYMIKEDFVLTIPNPHKQEISVDLLSRILKQASIKRDDWLK